MSRARRTGLAALLAALALGGGAAPPPAGAVSREDAAAERRERRALDLINAATTAMRRDPACRWRESAPTTYTDAAPSAALQATLILLRRPAIPQDEVSADLHTGLGRIRAQSVYRRWIRMGRAADGSEHYLVVARDRGLPEPLSRACLRRRHAALVRLTAREDRRVRTIALRTERRLNREEHPAGGLPRREAIYLFERGPDGSLGGGGGGVDLAWLKQNGLFTTAWVRGTELSRVTGLIPDGVATIEATFSRRANRGPYQAPDVYPEDLTLVVPVQDNLVSFLVPRDAGDAFPATMAWRAADGSVVRRVRGQR